MAVDEQQPEGIAKVAQAGHDAEQRGTVAAVHNGKASVPQCRSDTAIQQLGHRQQCGFVDQARAGSATGLGWRQSGQIVDGGKPVTGERVEQSRVAQRCRSERLIAWPAVSVERHADQCDVSHHPILPLGAKRAEATATAG